MRKVLWLALFGSLFASGCQKKNEVTVSTPEGTMTVSEEGGKTTIQSPDGKIEIDDSGKEVTISDGKGGKVSFSDDRSADPRELGVEIYPGAVLADQQATAGRIETESATTLTAIFSTPDSIKKVVDFYKAKLKGGQDFTSGEVGMAIGTNAEGHEVSVTAMAEKEAKLTKITIITRKLK